MRSSFSHHDYSSNELKTDGIAVPVGGSIDRSNPESIEIATVAAAVC